MARVQVDTPAPEFVLEDWTGREVRPSDFKGSQNVVLVFNRGFS